MLFKSHFRVFFFLFQKWCPFCIFILSVYSSVFHFILVLIFKQTSSTERYSLFLLKCFCFLIHLVFKTKPKPYRISGQQRLGSACASAQSDQGLGFPLTEWLNNVDKPQRTWLGYIDVQDYQGIRYSNMIRFSFFMLWLIYLLIMYINYIFASAVALFLFIL